MGKSVRYFGGTGTAPMDGVIPFCNKITASQTQDHPFLCDIDQLAEIYWRVKKWELEITYYDTALDETKTHAETLEKRTSPSFVNAVPAHETDLTCPHPWSDGGATSTPSIFLAGTPGDDSRYVTTNSKYAPQFYLNYYDLNGTFTLTSHNTGTSNLSLELSNSTISVPITIMGGTLTSATLTATEYWPYAQQSDGLAVYNTTTGAVLAGRDPHS